MSKERPHKLTRLLLIGLTFVFGTAITSHAQLRTVSLESVGDSITCYIGNSIHKLTPDKFRIQFRGNSKETQEFFEEVAPYTDLTTYLYAVPVTDTTNVEICPSNGGMNYIAYNANWLQGVYQDTNSKWTLYAIIAHEVGHYALAHDRRSVGSNPEIELAADEYAGEVLAKMKASLKDALDAYHSDKIGSHRGDETHPSIDKRLAAVEKGWRHIRGTQPPTEGSAETNENSRECLNCIQRGPVELKDTLYRGGSDNKSKFRFKMTTVQFNADDDVRKAAFKITEKSGTHVWDNKKYYWRKKDKEDRLLLAYWNLTAKHSGWVIVENIEGQWYYKTNEGQWKMIDRGQEVRLSWHSSGQKVTIILYVPNLSNGWTVGDIQYSFGYSD